MYQNCYMNREVSWLKFNERVLDEAADPAVPLCERLGFVSIFQNNLDEFFMIRVGTIQDQMLLKDVIHDNKTNMTDREQLQAIIDFTAPLCMKRDAIYASIMKEIASHGVLLVKFSDLSNEETSYMENYFDSEISPLLSPMIVGKKQSFPFMANGLIYAVVVMETVRGKEKIGIIHCGGGLFERMVSLPGRPGTYILVEEVILHFVPRIFYQYTILGKSLVKITRNADINLDSLDDEDQNYRDLMTEAIKMRKKLAAVRLELTRELDQTIVQALCFNLGLRRSQVFLSNVPLNMNFVPRIRDALRDHTELFYQKHMPAWPSSLDRTKSMFEQVSNKDILLHYPYDSIKPFLNLLQEAIEDESVISIKMTLYRLASQSKVVEALIEAAENGKEIVVLVELKARFDEENNIEWSRRLENAGCQVIYGIDGVKVHSKLCLITRRVNKKLEYITQIGTGNFNEKTAELYTDLALITSNPVLGNEMAALFRQIGINEVATGQPNLLVAPCGLQNRLIEMIDEQIALAELKQPSYIGLKINSITDIILINKLIEASMRGVTIEMLVRGICCLIPGVEGVTENITVHSIVGRFLEHSRIYIFGIDDPKVYIGSADWMTRNTLRRIEVAVPIFDETLKHQLLDMFHLQLQDNVKTRILRSDGIYERCAPKDTPINSQDYFSKMTYM